jgi:hypothetical protein
MIAGEYLYEVGRRAYCRETRNVCGALADWDARSNKAIEMASQRSLGRPRAGGSRRSGMVGRGRNLTRQGMVVREWKALKSGRATMCHLGVKFPYQSESAAPTRRNI